MAPRRRTQFVAGRSLAREALERLGCPPTALPRGAAGAPVWPSGFVGSITHCGEGEDGWCAVAVARSADCRSLGLDAELNQPLSPSLVDRILRPAERRLPEIEAAGLAAVFFSVKEALYKALNPLTGVFLDFHDVEVGLDRDAEHFEARILRDGWPPSMPRHVTGGYRQVAGLVISAVELPVPGR
jgi:4'-phosphopantetheinyl transferase EntD